MSLPSLLAVATTLLLGQSGPATITQNYVDQPVDAISIGIPSPDLTVKIRGQQTDGTWTAWETVEPNTEQVATATESDLLMFPAAVTSVQVQTTDTHIVFHPIRVSDALPTYNVASLSQGAQPHILSRSEWGADDSFLYTGKPATSTDTTGGVEDADTTPVATDPLTQSNSRVAKCQQNAFNFPDEFKVAKTVTSQDGKQLRWADQYSKQVKLLVVHHTAMQVMGDTRSGAERMRALYAYHANSRGWGDIGYHYVIDDKGQIFEGKSGGAYVVGGHAYCDNIGTIGIALMGNFEIEQPTQDQVRSLQWLLKQLSTQYGIKPGAQTEYHGVTLPTIIGHRDLLDTECPGFYLYGVLDQIRKHVMDGDLTALVTFPIKQTTPTEPYVDRTQQRLQQRLQQIPAVPAFTEGISPTSSTTLAGKPEAQLLFSLRYQAGPNGGKKGQTVGTVTRSDISIGLWMKKDDAYLRVRDAITLPQAVPPGGQLLLQMRVQLPNKESTAQLVVGNAVLALNVSGRKFIPKGTTPTFQTSDTSSLQPIQIIPRLSSSSSSSRASIPVGTSSSSSSSVSTTSTLIRIRLATQDAGMHSCADANLDMLRQRYRGTVNCLTANGAPSLINTLTLDDYMKGIAEEPDTEPYEKQRAFAIAARTYALFYIDPAHRKFAGVPYDGSDDPATFQKYTGKSNEAANPQWLKAIASTAGQVLTKNNQVIKPPYFSSDAGHTLSPADVGWSDFPFAEIFTSKPDPWCSGMTLNGHGVGMSGCGAEGQANAGNTAEQILQYYYPGTILKQASSV